MLLRVMRYHLGLLWWRLLCLHCKIVSYQGYVSLSVTLRGCKSFLRNSCIAAHFTNSGDCKKSEETQIIALFRPIN